MKLKMILTNSCLFICFALTLLLQGCIRKMAFGNGEKWIPKDLDVKNSVFIVAKFGASEKENRKAESFMQKKYPYGYEFINIKDTINFPDKTKYRFILMPITQILHPRDENDRPIGPVPACDFYFYDRLKDIKYPQLRKGSKKAIVTFRPIIATMVNHAKK